MNRRKSIINKDVIKDILSVDKPENSNVAVEANVNGSVATNKIPEKKFNWYEVSWHYTGEEKERCNNAYAKDDSHAKRIILQKFGKTYTFEEMLRREMNKQSSSTGVEFGDVKMIDKEASKKRKKNK